jgi:hypothetical protein
MVRRRTAWKKEDEVSVPLLCKTGSGCMLKKAISKTTCKVCGDPHLL